MSSLFLFLFHFQLFLLLFFFFWLVIFRGKICMYTYYYKESLTNFIRLVSCQYWMVVINNNNSCWAYLQTIIIMLDSFVCMINLEKQSMMNTFVQITINIIETRVHIIWKEIHGIFFVSSWINEYDEFNTFCDVFYDAKSHWIQSKLNGLHAKKQFLNVIK